jgi:hypothetical protein
MKKNKSKSVENKAEERRIRRERVKQKVQDGYYAINMRELSDIIGFAYSEVRRWKKDGWLPLIPGTNKLFYDHFCLAVCRRYGVDKNAANSPNEARELIEWVKKNFPNGKEAPAYLIEHVRAQAKTLVRHAMADNAIPFDHDVWAP